MRTGLIVAVLLGWTSVVFCQEKSVQVIIDDLKNPCGIAIQPSTGSIFVSDSGRGRVFEIVEKKPRDTIVDFPVKQFELDRNLQFGPLGIIFRGQNILIVGTGGSDDGEDSVSVFDLEERDGEPLKAEDHLLSLTLESAEGEAAEGDFFSFAMTRGALYTTTGGDKDKGWVAVADLAINEIKNLRRQIPTAQLSKTAGPGGLAVSPDGHVVVGQMGSRDTPGDSILAFYSPAGELLDKFQTGLNDIVALKYGPRRKRLYALDFSWAEPAKGGLYQLIAVDSADGCEAKLLATLERPTAMAFDRNGNLYLTVCGLPDETPGQFEGEDQILPNPGKVVLIKNVD